MIERWAESSGGRCNIEATLRQGTRVRACWRMQPTAAAAIGADEGEADFSPTAQTSLDRP
jgi:hypothetical protein